MEQILDRYRGSRVSATVSYTERKRIIENRPRFFSAPVYSYASSDFRDGANSSTEYCYNGVGALVSDANKGIAHIEYDALNHPTEIQFTNGSIIQYIYSPDGEKLQTKYITAVENVMVPVNTTLELQPTQIAAVDSIEYVGNIVYHNGEIDKFLFSGGYVQIQSSQATIARPFLFFEGDEPTPEELEQYNQLLQEWIEALEAAHNMKQLTFHYYTQDHLGNNRVVMNEDGTIEQVTHYYPFGGVIADISTNQSLQPYKYNGKEFDRMHGLDWYDYGARMYDPALPMWTSVDPMAEKYYHISPYVYCANNPVNAIDPDGRIIVFANGTSESFKQKYFAAISLLNEKGCNYFLSKIANDPFVILYIAETSLESSFFDIKNEQCVIYWNPYVGVSTTNNVDLSPTTVLNHEADHASGAIYNYIQWKEDCVDEKNNPYGSKEEERVITGSEQETAKALGEIDETQVTRKDHSGLSFYTITPTSNKQDYNKKSNIDLDEIFVFPQKKYDDEK